MLQEYLEKLQALQRRAVGTMVYFSISVLYDDFGCSHEAISVTIQDRTRYQEKEPPLLECFRRWYGDSEEATKSKLDETYAKVEAFVNKVLPIK